MIHNFTKTNYNFYAMKIRLPALFQRKKIKIYALVGPAGTGKSFRAKLVADSHSIDMLIDHGLLIKNRPTLAGISAKKAESYLEAVRIAIFEDPEHREDVRNAIAKEKPKSILVLGTSEKMITRICNRLGIPLPFLTINIGDVASKEEIEKAVNARKSGKHVIPVPIIEVEKRYPSSTISALLLSFSRNIFSSKKRFIEKTIVQPDYESPAGTITISKAALTQMVLHCANEFDQSVEIKKLIIKENGSAFSLKIDLQIPMHSSLPFRLTELRNFIIKNIEKYTGILLQKVDINIVSMSQSFTEKRKRT